MILADKWRQTLAEIRHRWTDATRHCRFDSRKRLHTCECIHWRVQRSSTHQRRQRYFPLGESGDHQKYSRHENQCHQAQPHKVIERQQKNIIRVRQFWCTEYEHRSGRRRHRNVLYGSSPIVGHEQCAGSNIRFVLHQFADHAVPEAGAAVSITPRRHCAVPHGCVHKGHQIVGQHVVGLGDGVDVFVSGIEKFYS